ncbi:MAG: hypothetical protein ACXWP5_14080 [Bdellovibrionota bacterium]
MKKIILGLFFAFASVAYADGGSIIVVNQGPNDASVNMDGSYLCTAAANSTCSSPVSNGTHQFHAVFSDGQSVDDIGTVTDGTQLTWTIGEQ